MGAEYCDERVSVCVCVCLSVLPLRGHISDSARPIFTKIFVRYGHGSIHIWRRCDKLCTSGFVDDVIFPIMGPTARGPLLTVALVAAIC